MKRSHSFGHGLHDRRMTNEFPMTNAECMYALLKMVFGQFIPSSFVIPIRVPLTVWFTAWACLVGVTAKTLAVTPATIVGSDLVTRRVDIQSLKDNQLRYFGIDRELRAEDIERTIQIRFHPKNGDAQPLAVPMDEVGAVVVLVDGQRLRGRWVGVADEGQALRWEHSLLGIVGIKLDRIVAVDQRQTNDEERLIGHLGPHGARSLDVVHLANGDTLRGIVLAFDEGGFRFQPTGAAKAVTLPWNRAHALQLANPGSTSYGDDLGHLVWFRDGSRVRAQHLAIAQGQFSFRPLLHSVGDANEPPTMVHTKLEDVRQIDLTSMRGRLVDVTGLKITTLNGGRVFEMAMAPQFEPRRIRLHAPVAIGLDLPKGTKRFAATATLGDAAFETDGLVWADLDLIVRIDGRIELREHLSAARSGVSLNIAAVGRQMTVELDEAANGPVMDRLTLRDPILFVEHDESVTNR